MLAFKVREDTLVSAEDTISHKTFEELTGKHIDLKVRVGRGILVEREGGHIRVYDYELLPGRRYKKYTQIVDCVYVDAKGVALLKPHSRGIKTVTTNAHRARDWEIVT